MFIANNNEPLKFPAIITPLISKRYSKTLVTAHGLQVVLRPPLICGLVFPIPVPTVWDESNHLYEFGSFQIEQVERKPVDAFTNKTNPVLPHIPAMNNPITVPINVVEKALQFINVASIRTYVSTQWYNEMKGGPASETKTNLDNCIKIAIIGLINENDTYMKFLIEQHYLTVTTSPSLRILFGATFDYMDKLAADSYSQYINVNTAIYKALLAYLYPCLANIVGQYMTNTGIDPYSPDLVGTFAITAPSRHPDDYVNILVCASAPFHLHTVHKDQLHSTDRNVLHTVSIRRAQLQEQGWLAPYAI